MYAHTERTGMYEKTVYIIFNLFLKKKKKGTVMKK